MAVNDGSRDGSLEILTDYARRNPALRVLDQPNRGSNATRKRLIDESRGEFLFFLDSDDYISAGTIETLFEAVEKFDCDVAAARTVVVRNGRIVDRYDDGVPVKPSVGELVFGMITPRISRGMAGRLYRRRVFDGIEFPTDIHYGEDYMINLQVAKRPDFRGTCFPDSDAAIYFYNRNEASMTHVEKWNSVEYIELFSRRFDAMFSDWLNSMPECRDHWFIMRIWRAYEYIRHSRNPWRGDSPLIESAIEAFSAASMATRRLIPRDYMTVIKLYRKHRRFKPLTDMMAMVLRWRRSLSKRVSWLPREEGAGFLW